MTVQIFFMGLKSSDIELTKSAGQNHPPAGGKRTQLIKTVITDWNTVKITGTKKESDLLPLKINCPAIILRRDRYGYKRLFRLDLSSSACKYPAEARSCSVGRKQYPILWL